MLDCYRFSPKPLPLEPDQSPDRPDICLGTDAFHTPPELVARLRADFEAAGFSVAIDRPFAGALVPLAYYAQDKRVQAAMIEVNRGLYLYQASAIRRPEFDLVKARIQTVVKNLL